MSEKRNLCLSGKGLTKVFGFGRTRTVAVDHVDFDFYEGEIISIVGESGSGKTTLAKMLLGLINPYGGGDLLPGEDSATSVPTVRKRRIGNRFRRSFKIRSPPTTSSTRLTPCCWIALR